MTTGSNNFLQRLHDALPLRALPPFRILKSDTPIPSSRQKEVLIGRFDGLFMYKFNLAGIYNFTRLTKASFLPRLSFFEKNFPKSICMVDKLAARYLNRRDVLLRKVVDSVVFQSSLSRQQHHLVAGPEPFSKNCYEIPNGVPLGVFHKHSSSLAFEGNPKLVITANFRLVKRLRDAVDIINELKKKYRDAVLHVIGPLDSLVKESLLSLNLNKCVFHGAVESGDLPLIYSSMDVGLSPALLDPCPNSVIEMMACGLPVLTTSASGAAELVPDSRFVIPENVGPGFTESHNFLRLPRVDVDKWCRCIEDVLENQVEFSEMSTSAARERFSIDLVAKKYSEVIIKTWDEKLSCIGSNVRS